MIDPQVLLQILDRVDAVREELRKHQDCAAEIRLELQTKINDLRAELSRHQEVSNSLRRDIERLEAALESGRDWQTQVMLELNRLNRTIDCAKIEITNIGGDNTVDGDQALGGDVKNGKS